MHKQSKLLFVLLATFLVFGAISVTAQDNPDGFPEPEMVVLAGTLQDDAGCSGEWQTDCDDTALSYNEDSGVWEISLDLEAGDYEYKIALDGGWDRNYGADCEAGGDNIAMSVPDDQTVTFTYDHSTGCIENSLPVSNDADSDTDDAEDTEETTEEGSDQPEMVNVPGTIQSELGCDGQWAPDCEATALDYVDAYDIWERTFDALPAGDYEYKVALNGNWTVNFGAFADQDGDNIALNKSDDEPITFFYDHESNWVMDTVRHSIITAPGSYQSEIGCEDDWLPGCMITWLQDTDGDGIYTYSTNDIPAGEYEAKVAINRSWDENYGAEGEPDGNNISFTVDEDGDTVTFTYDPNITTMVITAGGSAVSSSSLQERRAYWVTEDTIAWDIDPELADSFQLLSSADASLSVGLTGLEGEYESTELTVNDDGLSADVLEKFPHLQGLTALQLSDTENVPDILKSQFAVAAYSEDDLVNISGLQIPGVLDDMYTYPREAGALGATFDGDVPTLNVWAPTAQNVALNVYDDAEPRTEPTAVEMDYDADTGVWSVTGDAGWYGKYYTYQVDVFAPTEMMMVSNEVTDPYSVSLSMNSTRSQLIDLSRDELKPDGWDTLDKPNVGAPENITVYELHMRDFSAFDDAVPEDLRGTYRAFTVDDSGGMAHLQALADAGLTHLHLLPTFDIATINENKDRWFQPDFDALEDLPPASEEQQAALQPIRDLDPYNWGYDPYHYNVPEGSYSTDPNSTARITEYREMVQAVNNSGLRFVQDVVYNHTNASGQAFRSVLDKVVPGYYHRLDASGRVTTSTCCRNTATEHNMMRRLMIDSVLLHATEYKIDGFRFDLMGHHMKSDMLAVREALDELTLENDGVDGSQIYVYGEGWNFGEVADGVRGVNATQFNMAGTGIGTFNDRLRDAVRGGSPFGGRTEQGLGNGAYVFPNDFDEINQELERALLFADQTRIGLAGNLAEYEFVAADGELVSGQDIDYNGSPAGYTLDPQENVVYVSKHDNETLFDNMLFRIPRDTSIDDIARMQNLSLSFVMYSQGVPFFHAGSDLLRSKSLDRDSYNSGDWFNRIDWTYEDNNFGVGLPPAWSNESQWEMMRPILERDDWQPDSEQITFTRDVFRDMLQVRYSTPLFRLETAEQIQQRVGFHNTGEEQTPGVIVMSINDTVGDDLDPAHDMVVVVFNATDETIEHSVDDLQGMDLRLHPILADGADEVVQNASFDSDSGTLNVPALTTAVFVAPHDG